MRVPLAEGAFGPKVGVCAGESAWGDQLAAPPDARGPHDRIANTRASMLAT
jgi:hypothetical protein